VRSELISYINIGRATLLRNVRNATPAIRRFLSGLRLLMRKLCLGTTTDVSLRMFHERLYDRASHISRTNL
jgi:hypothetical protein